MIQDRGRMSQTTVSHLKQGHCVPCEGGTKPLAPKEFQMYLPQLPEWKVASNNLSISREFVFDNFKEALVFTNEIGKIAEEEGHHPNIFLHDWKYLTTTLTTHAINGLSINDFVLAAKIDSIKK